jgi:hypothetical protein
MLWRRWRFIGHADIAFGMLAMSADQGAYSLVDSTHGIDGI